jgi:hypothetical protein
MPSSEWRQVQVVAVSGFVAGDLTQAQVVAIEASLEAAADEEAAVGSDGDVAFVVEAVDVGAEEEAVVETVLASLGDGADVGGVQDGEGLFSRDGAAALVVVRHQDAEGALAQARAVGAEIAEHRERGRGEVGHRCDCCPADADLLPEAAAGFGIGLEVLSLDDAPPELRG